jgi:high-affinity nickel-transport protein
MTWGHVLIAPGGAICGTFIIFGGLSVILYKPWRRRIDAKRVHSAHFEPLSQDSTRVRIEEEGTPITGTRARDGFKDPNVDIEPVEVTDAAGPARH